MSHALGLSVRLRGCGGLTPSGTPGVCTAEIIVANSIQFGWRVPDFPEVMLPDPQQRATLLREQIYHYMDTIEDGLSEVFPPQRIKGPVELRLRSMLLERGQVMHRVFAHPICRVNNDATIQLGGILLSD